MKQNKLQGIITALVTPTDSDGSFNPEGMRELVENGIRNGIKGVLVLGTCGEFNSFSLDEKSKIFDTVIQQVNSRVPVLAGCGAVTTKETIKICQIAQEKNIDYLAVVTPYYICPTQDDLYEHYREVAAACTLPILLYNIPSRTGVCLEAETVRRLKEISNIVGIKDSSGDLELFKKYMELQDDGFAVMQGMDGLYLDSFMLGADAGISGPANSIPANQVAIYDSVRSGDTTKARYYQDKFKKFKAVVGLAPGPTIAKEAANIVGLHAGPPVKPLRRPTGSIFEKLREVLMAEFPDSFVNKEEKR